MENGRVRIEIDEVETISMSTAHRQHVDLR
jgi:hypothetical protein